MAGRAGGGGGGKGGVSVGAGGRGRVGGGRAGGEAVPRRSKNLLEFVPDKYCNGDGHPSWIDSFSCRL